MACAILGVGMGAAASLGWTTGMIVFVILLGCAAFIFVLAGSRHYLAAGHCNFYWQKTGHLHNDPVDLRIALDKLDQSIATAKAMRNVFSQKGFELGLTNQQ